MKRAHALKGNVSEKPELHACISTANGSRPRQSGVLELSTLKFEARDSKLQI